MKLRIGLYSLPMIMASTLIAESLPEKFFEQHCLNCHGEDMAKGDLTLHDLAADFTHAETVDIWQIVLEQLETGEMPPKKKPRPDPSERDMTISWIRSQFEKNGITAEIDHKRRAPEFGNHLDHKALFDGSHQGPPYSPPRLWRLSPHAYDQFVSQVRGVRHATTIHQPFVIDESKGVIADYTARHFADAATLQLLMMNCESMAL